MQPDIYASAMNLMQLVTFKHCTIAGAVMAAGRAPAKAAAWAWSTAVTSNWTRAAESQQQEELAPTLPQVLAVVSLVTWGIILKASVGARPSCAAAQLAKEKNGVPSLLGPHSCSSAVTRRQP